MRKPTFLYGEYNINASITASDTAIGLDAENMLFASEDMFWSPSDSVGTKTLIIDRNETSSFDSIALLGKNMTGAVLTVSECSTVSGTYSVIESDIEIASDFNAWWHEFFVSATPSLQFVKIEITGMSVNFLISFILLSLIKELPQFSESTNYSLKPEGSVQRGGNGAFIGSTVNYTMRELSIRWPQFSTNSEQGLLFPNIIDWANFCIKYMKPFFFVPDLDNEEVYFAWIEQPKFSAVLQNKDQGIYTISSMTAITQVA